MYRFNLSILVFIISIFTLSAQNNTDAERVITNLLNTVKTEAVKTNFILKISEKNALNSQSNSGTFTLKGNKFVLEMDQLKAWFDGKTQWAYASQSNEVSITEPNEKELGETNPMSILSGYKTKAIIRFAKTKSTENYIIEMLPKLKNSDFTKIEVIVNKLSGNLITIKLNQKNGTNSTLIITNYQKGLKISDESFTFNRLRYKDVIMNDLR